MDDIYFQNRKEAGQRLATLLTKYQKTEAIVYSLPRGGVLVGKEVADALDLPLDILIVRKIGHPFNPEFAIGAITDDGHLIGHTVLADDVDPAWIKEEIKREQAEIKRRYALYFGGRKPIVPSGKIAIIVDDGVATGSTMLAAIHALQDKNPAKVVVAVPVAPPDVAQILTNEADEFVAVEVPEPFLGAVGSYYIEFPQVTDEEVVNLLHSARRIS